MYVPSSRTPPRMGSSSLTLGAGCGEMSSGGWPLGARGPGGGYDEVTCGHRLEGASIKLLGTDFQVCPIGEDPSLCSEVGLCGL